MTQNYWEARWPLVEKACRNYCRMIGADPDQIGYFHELWSGPRQRWEQYSTDALYHIMMNEAVLAALEARP